jgi:hypothetical protein
LLEGVQKPHQKGWILLIHWSDSLERYCNKLYLHYEVYKEYIQCSRLKKPAATAATTAATLVATLSPGGCQHRHHCVVVVAAVVGTAIVVLVIANVVIVLLPWLGLGQ